MEDKLNEFRAINDNLYYSLPSADSIETKMIRDCLNALYQNSFPSTTLEEMENTYKKTKEEFGKQAADELHTYKGYYCPHTVQNQIIDHYLSIYNLEKNWEDYVNVVLRDLEKGPTIDKYIEREDDRPGYRGYEHLPPLKEKIGEEAYQQVVDYIEKIKGFYRFEHNIDNIRFAIWNVAPNTFKDSTIKWQREHGNPDFDIADEEIEEKYFKETEDYYEDSYECENDENEEE